VIQPVRLAEMYRLAVWVASKDMLSMEMSVLYVMILRPWLAPKKMLLILSAAAGATPKWLTLLSFLQLVSVQFVLPIASNVILMGLENVMQVNVKQVTSSRQAKQLARFASISALNAVPMILTYASIVEKLDTKMQLVYA
jgi:hypothetical protein